MTTQNASPTTTQTPYGAWFDNGIAQALLVPVTNARGLDAQTGRRHRLRSAGRQHQHHLHLDRSDRDGTTAGTALTDPELRSPTSASTPLGRSLFYARLYFENYV